MPVLSTRIVLDCFYLLIFYSEKFLISLTKHPAAREKKICDIPRVGVRLQLARIDCVSFEIET